MSKDYRTAFSEAVSNILSQFGMAAISLKEVIGCGKNIDASGVVCIVGVFGDLTGNVIFSMSEDGAKGIASCMMGGMEIEAFDEIAQSAISELGNMLAANACIGLSEMGLEADISTPTLMQGIFTLSGNYEKANRISMDADGIDFDVIVSLEEREQK
jgi:chemotaxis protein CheX